MPDKCKCVDFQILKLQELPDGAPQGEIPRHLTLYCDRYLCEKVVPGNKAFILGIYSIKKVGRPSKVQLAFFLICVPHILTIMHYSMYSMHIYFQMLAYVVCCM